MHLQLNFKYISVLESKNKTVITLAEGGYNEQMIMNIQS